MNLSNAKVGDELFIQYGGYHGDASIRKVASVNKRFVKDENGTEWTLGHGSQKGCSSSYNGAMATLIDSDTLRDRANHAVEQTELRRMVTAIDRWLTMVQRSRPYTPEMASAIRAAHAAVQTGRAEP